MVTFPEPQAMIVAETFRHRGVAPAATVIAGEVGRFRTAGP